MLLLMLGTATAWADKYYMPKSYRNKVNPRLALENAVGKRFMIYNTAVGYDAVDKTGFLRNGGAEFTHDKSKERDLFIYNESFVYTLEAFDDNNDGHNDWYAIKSLSTGTYVDCKGKTTHKNAADAKLNIYNWVAAKKVGVADWVNMECWEYNIIAREDIDHQDVVLVIGGKYTQDGQEKSAYWNGATNSFATDEWLGHPYVFYEAIELTNEDELPIAIEKDFLQELHVYSRCDMYAAQRVYGLVHVHSDNDDSHITVLGQNDVHGVRLCDGDGLTSVTVEEGRSLQFFTNNGKMKDAVQIYLQRNADKTNVPEFIKVEVSDNGETWNTVAESLKVSLAPSCTTSVITLGDGEYSYVRISNADTKAPMSLSEVYILPVNGVMDDVLRYVNETTRPGNVIFTKASAQVYAETIEEYNEQFPAVKLLSGIPYPGNKYRIYVDMLSNDEHVKPHITINSSGYVLVGGNYMEDGITADTRKNYEWYCEKLPDGSLAFKNVATGKYLTLNYIPSEDPYGWNIYTNLSQRNGVPLQHNWNYLAVKNENGNLSFASDITQVQYGEISTDFVFLPVNMSEGEKKITIKANELVMRNTELKYNGTVYSMPFSHVFTENDLPILELQCPVIHPFKGVKVNGESKDNVASQVTEGEKKLLKFNWDNIKNGDVLELVFKIETPFEITPAATGAKPQLYFIRNKRPYGLQPQQARPNRAADANIGIEGDGPISVVGDKFDYAKFDSRGTEMHLVQDKKDNPTSLDATSLFFFTQTESNDTARYYSVNVNNATTVMKFSTTGVWDEEGGTWYVQPDKAGAYSGYNIGATKLNATNNPSDAWCDVRGADIISFSTPDDDGTAWEFVPVSDNVAKVMLKTFIDKVAAELSAKFEQIKPEIAARFGYDMYKVECYKYMVNEIKSRTVGYYEGNDEDDIFKLVQYAQNIHMIEHEVVYTLYGLPLLSDETKMDGTAQFANPKWYYVRNVVSGNYAAYTSYDRAMNLEQNPTGTYPNGGMLLKNMFYFAGNKNTFDYTPNDGISTGYQDYPGNNLILDEYLKVHVHNFMSKKLTLVSKNLTLLELKDKYPGYGIQKITDIENDSKKDTLRNNENWSIDAVYELDGSSFNAYGSCLLSSQADALNDAFPNAFQVYFKDNRTVAIRAGNRNWDLVVFNHTQEFFSTVRVVVSYAYGTLTIEVYNSAGDVRVWSEKMELNNITALYSALPYDEETKSGIKVNSLVVKKTEKMNWKEHLDDAKYDLWYILPSSNLNNVDPAASNPRFAITLDGPNETNIGWTNASGIIDTDLGNQNNSSWQFERVTDFDNHIDELLAMYNLNDCVIYNKELAALMRLIKEKTIFIKAATNGAGEEAAFNEVYYAILNYNGPMPDELKAPKPGSLYTIHHTPQLLKNDFKVSDRNVIKINEDVNVEYEYDSRGVWLFEGTEENGFYALDGSLRLKSLHTQSYPYAAGFTADSIKLSDIEESSALAIEKVGACVVRLKTNEKYLATHGDYIVAGETAQSTDYIATSFRHENGANVVATSWLYDDVAINGTTVAGKINSGDITSFKTGGRITDAILCPNVNGKDNPTIELTFTYTGLPAGFAFNNIALDIHALSSSGDYQFNNDAPIRQWNVAVSVAEGSGEFGDFGTLSDIDIAKGVGTSGNVHKVWNLVGSYTKQTAEHLVVKLTVTKGTENAGCYFGLSSIELSNAQRDTWYIEEIINPEESVYYTTTVEDGYSTLMLGFDAVIPDGIEAHSGSVDGIVVDKKYLSMYQYESNILPANTPVVLHNSEEGETVDAKFYYSKIAGEQQPDSYMRGSLYHRVVSTDAIEAEEAYRGALINIYMLQSGKSGPKMYWIYEEYDKDGNLVNGGNNDDGKHVLCKANKAYIVIKSGEANNRSSFSFSLNKGGNATEIDEVEDEKCEVETIYDLQGRKLTEICHPGVYIINGKKVLVK